MKINLLYNVFIIIFLNNFLYKFQNKLSITIKFKYYQQIFFNSDSRLELSQNAKNLSYIIEASNPSFAFPNSKFICIYYLAINI